MAAESSGEATDGKLMPTTEQTLYDVRNGGAWITLNRPERRNALSPTLIAETHDHLLAANDDDEVRCVVITGSPPAFCAGADLKAKRGQETGGRVIPYPQLLTQIQDNPKPVIAAVNGPAFAGGLGIVGAVDISITADDVVFSFSEVRIGVIPAVISVVCLPKLGAHNAMKLFLTGERFSAQQSVDMGLVHRAVRGGFSPWGMPFRGDRYDLSRRSQRGGGEQEAGSPGAAHVTRRRICGDGTLECQDVRLGRRSGGYGRVPGEAQG